MIKALLQIIFLTIGFLANAQTMAKNTVSNAGLETSNLEHTINFTIGEPIVGLVANGESIDQGFWAGSLYVEPITEEKELGDIVIYPNPMEGELNVQTNNNPVYGITLFAVNGKMALKRSVEPTELQHQIDVSHLARGVYVLRLLIEGTHEEKLFKVIKR